MRYKILALRAAPGFINCPTSAHIDGESWVTLGQALEELAADGWEIESCPQQWPTERGDKTQLLILRHGNCTSEEDYAQQRKRLERRASGK